MGCVGKGFGCERRVSIAFGSSRAYLLEGCDDRVESHDEIHVALSACTRVAVVELIGASCGVLARVLSLHLLVSERVELTCSHADTIGEGEG